MSLFLFTIHYVFSYINARTPCRNARCLFVTTNMMYSDYSKNIGEDLETYIAMAKDFLDDVDARPNKLYRYKKYIVKKD